MANYGVNYAMERLHRPPLLGRFLECKDVDRMLVFVHCKPWDVELRNSVRNTWANKRLYDRTPVQVLFVVGLNYNYSQALQWEQVTK